MPALPPSALDLPDGRIAEGGRYHRGKGRDDRKSAHRDRATPLHDAARILFEQKVDALPMVENGKLVGVITNSDILRAFLDQD
jgi:CBS domain-containing protein